MSDFAAGEGGVNCYLRTDLCGKNVFVTTDVPPATAQSLCHPHKEECVSGCAHFVRLLDTLRSESMSPDVRIGVLAYLELKRCGPRQPDEHQQRFCCTTTDDINLKPS